MDKPPPTVIYDNVKDTVASNSQELLELVNEKIYNEFSSLFQQHPVIIVENKVPDDVLKWYQTYVFERSESICTPRSYGIDKEPEPKAINGSMDTTSGSTTIIEMISEDPAPQPEVMQNGVKNDLIQNQDSVAMEVVDLPALAELTGQAYAEDKQAEVANSCKDLGLTVEVANGCKDLDLTVEVTKDNKDYAMMEELTEAEAEDILNSLLNGVQSPPVEVDKNEVEAKHSQPVTPVNIEQKAQPMDTEAPSKVPDIVKTVAKVENISVLSYIDDENNILDFDEDDE